MEQEEKEQCIITVRGEVIYRGNDIEKAVAALQDFGKQRAYARDTIILNAKGSRHIMLPVTGGFDISHYA